jgi:DNA polymerase III psi subunit
MSLNEQTLSPSALKILLGQSLYSIDREQPQKTDTASPVSKRKYLVLLSEAPDSNDTRQTLLQGILDACRIGASDVNIIPAFRQDGDANTLREIYGASFVILFGVEPGDIRLPVYFPHFQPQQHDGVTYLTSPGLTDLQNDKTAKKLLWESLRKALSL